MAKTETTVKKYKCQCCGEVRAVYGAGRKKKFCPLCGDDRRMMDQVRYHGRYQTTFCCSRCGRETEMRSKRQIYCPACGAEIAKEFDEMDHSEDQNSIAAVNAKAREMGLSYGKYVARYMQ